MTEEQLREQVLTEFKQVLKLAPADYTENCTNVVMSLFTKQLELAKIEAKIEEIGLIKEREFGLDYGDITDKYLSDRLYELIKQKEEIKND